MSGQYGHTAYPGTNAILQHLPIPHPQNPSPVRRRRHGLGDHRAMDNAASRERVRRGIDKRGAGGSGQAASCTDIAGWRGREGPSVIRTLETLDGTLSVSVTARNHDKLNEEMDTSHEHFPNADVLIRSRNCTSTHDTICPRIGIQADSQVGIYFNTRPESQSCRQCHATKPDQITRP